MYQTIGIVTALVAGLVAGVNHWMPNSYPLLARYYKNNVNVQHSKEKTPEEIAAARALLEDRIAGALLGGSIGDALGRVTEFIETTEAIKHKYGAQGVVSFKSFMPGDWIVHPYTRECIAPYTDDTVMSLIVLEESLKHADAKPLIRSLAGRFKKLFGSNAYDIDPLYHIRAHGIQNRTACTRSSTDFNSVLKEVPSYDKKNDPAVAQEGGCGSVMRAWPLGLVFYQDIKKVAVLADYQSRITHRNPLARAASAAIAVGVASLLQGSDADTAVTHMIEAAQKFEQAEHHYKVNSCKVLDARSITESKLFTSDMIAYAAQQARSGVTPELVLGTHNNKQGYRSSEGFLLGWAADEAVAAAVYIFLRHPHFLQNALQEAVNTPGDSDSIATLAGVLVGAHDGFKNFKETGFDYSPLENKAVLEKLVETTLIRIDK